MKRLIFGIVLLLTIDVVGQGYIFDTGTGSLKLWQEWKSEWDIDTVLNVGDEKCFHDWVKENLRMPSTISCLVFHDSRGCPDNWGREEWICRKCLRDVIVSENRILLPEKEKPKSEFEILKEKIKDKK